MNREKLREYLENRCYITKDVNEFEEGSVHCSINDVLDAMEDSHKGKMETSVYVMNFGVIEEFDNKSEIDITDEEYKTFADSC